MDADIEYTFHCYDHCPFGNRVAFLMDHFGIKYQKVVYGYGSGAIPQDCDYSQILDGKRISLGVGIRLFGFGSETCMTRGYLYVVAIVASDPNSKHA